MMEEGLWAGWEGESRGGGKGGGRMGGEEKGWRKGRVRGERDGGVQRGRAKMEEVEGEGREGRKG